MKRLKLWNRLLIVIYHLTIVIFISCSFSVKLGRKNIKNNPNIQVFFTNINKSKKIGISPEQGLFQMIQRSEKTINCAFYQLSSRKIIKALVLAKMRGVQVNIVLEEDNINKGKIQQLLDAGIDIVVDGRESLMHNKFVVIDDLYVWTGSYNPTYNGNYSNNNNAVSIESARISDCYNSEFHEMFSQRVFGNRNNLGPFYRLKNIIKRSNVDNNISCYFAPEDGVERVIMDRLSNASKNVEIMAFSFTSRKIADELIILNKRGVRVRVVFEERGIGGRYSQYARLKINGIGVHFDNNRSLMHHKVIIIDGKTILTGSYNLSKNANIYNDENMLIIEDKVIAQIYSNEFEKIF